MASNWFQYWVRKLAKRLSDTVAGDKQRRKSLGKVIRSKLQVEQLEYRIAPALVINPTFNATVPQTGLAGVFADGAGGWWVLTSRKPANNERHLKN